MEDFRGSTVLITGASSGIGEELARRLAKEGCRLVLVARRRARLETLARELAGTGAAAVHVVAADLAVPGAAAALVEQLDGLGLGIDVLVNNAGFGRSGAFVDIDLAVEQEMIRLNVMALVELCKLLGRRMVARGRGHILNVASTAGFQPGPLMAVYYASKAFVLSFSEALAAELRDSGVVVCTLCPGPTRTGFAARADLGATRLVNRVSRMATASDVAGAALRGLRRGPRLIIPGPMNKLGVFSLRLAPRRWVTALVRRLQEKVN
ncbi:MAG TPA: SDR family oxidoreductase [Thermoanaerobaculaceae bacterium]|nr:SDR family oxidoreductase [Thermoanaerobaculaceae bacterium]HPS77707.1 SDR family oxidoreductase [Thermoanaerobaculaceae bacterium]